MSGRPEATALLASARQLLGEGIALLGPEAGGPLRTARDRLEEPLRVAVAGRVKAGKSTLLNALVGEPLAPTDAGECTKVVTWYRNGTSYGATIHTRDGRTAAATVRRSGGSVEVDLGPVAAEAVERLVVEWPAAPLQRLTLVDTPGIASIRSEISARTSRFLLPGEEDEPETPADAVVYLLRHLHPADTDFLEAFSEQSFARATPANAIAVLSRADEVGGGSLEAMVAARGVAAGYRDDPAIRRLCQTVVAVSGLVAETAVTLRHDEFARIRTLADADRAEVDLALRSAAAFVATDGAGAGSLPADERRALLARFGLWGLRLSIALVRTGRAPSSPALAAALVEHSSLGELRATLEDQLGARAEALKARAGLLLLRRTLVRHPDAGAAGLLRTVEGALASAHVLEELRLLPALRSDALALRPDQAALAERLLGGAGASTAARLGVDEDAGRDAVVAAATGEAARWHGVAAHPLSAPAVVHAASVLARTAEGLATVPTTDPPPSAVTLQEHDA